MHGAPPNQTAVASDLPPDCATFLPACDVDTNNDKNTNNDNTKIIVNNHNNNDDGDNNNIDNNIQKIKMMMTLFSS